MAKVLVLGGGFAGVVAAESLARRLGPEHRITLVSRQREFTFFPSLVRLAFGRLKLEDVFFDLAHAMGSRRVALTQAEVTGYDPAATGQALARGDQWAGDPRPGRGRHRVRIRLWDATTGPEPGLGTPDMSRSGSKNGQANRAGGPVIRRRCRCRTPIRCRVQEAKLSSAS